jgi:hypothetical protein
VTANGTVRPLVTLLVVPEEGLQMVGHQLSGCQIDALNQAATTRILPGFAS